MAAKSVYPGRAGMPGTFGRQLADTITTFQINFPRSSIFQKGAGLKFYYQNIGLGKNFLETKLLDVIRRLQINFSHSSMFQKGAELKFWPRKKLSGDKVGGYY